MPPDPKNSMSRLLDAFYASIPTVVIGIVGVGFAMWKSQSVSDERYAQMKIQVEEMKQKLDKLNDSVQQMIGAGSKK